MLTRSNLIRRLFSSTTPKNLLISRQNDDSTLLIQLNRPKALNALCDELVNELNQVLTEAETDNSVRTVILTGSDRAFAAGADIKEMAEKSYSEAYGGRMLEHWDRVSKFR